MNAARIKLATVGLGLLALGVAAVEWPRSPPPLGRVCDNLELDPADYPGAEQAHMRCGSLQLQDSFGFRVGREDWPDEGVVAIGDSFTYGWGVDEEDAWPALLGAVNAGIPCASAWNVADVVRWFHEPHLERRRGVVGQPDEIPGTPESPPFHTRPTAFLYGIYPNDVGERWETGREPFVVRDYVLDPGRIRGAFRAIVESARVPVYALVLENPVGANRWLVGRLEAEARAAGMRVLPSTYLDDHAGEDFRLADDEGHPDERAHRIYAAVFATALAGSDP